MKKFLAMLLALVMVLSLAACGNQATPDANNNDASDDNSDTPAEVTYAVEAGSAGEEVANEKGWKITSVGSQADALMEVSSGTSDAAIIDLLMAGAMVGEGTSYPDLKVTDEKLTSELYGAGCRKGSDLASYINSVMSAAYADGSMLELAKTYGVQEALLEQPAAEFTASESDSDVAYIQGKGKLVVGITEFAPMDYKDDNGEWIGFDADLAKLFAESLGVSVEFQEITWDYKVEELDSRAIDCVWNGMTLTDDVLAAMGTSNPYCTNYQTLVYPADRAAEFEGLTSLEGLNIAVESGSAGEDAAVALGATTVPVQAQSNALMEVAAGTSDAAVIDVLMAAEMTGEGTSYADLIYSLNLNEAQDLPSEEYGVGFRQGSDLVDAFNTFLAEKTADGTVLEVATTYGLQDAVILE